MIQAWLGGRVWSRDKNWTLGWRAESGLCGSGLQARPSSPCPQHPPCWVGHTHLSQSGVLGPTLSLRFPAQPQPLPIRAQGWVLHLSLLGPRLPWPGFPNQALATSFAHGHLRPVTGREHMRRMDATGQCLHAMRRLQAWTQTSPVEASGQLDNF